MNSKCQYACRGLLLGMLFPNIILSLCSTAKTSALAFMWETADESVFQKSRPFIQRPFAGMLIQTLWSCWFCLVIELFGFICVLDKFILLILISWTTMYAMLCYLCLSSVQVIFTLSMSCLFPKDIWRASHISFFWTCIPKQIQPCVHIKACTIGNT
jgi:hypothetical protein